MIINFIYINSDSQRKKIKTKNSDKNNRSIKRHKNTGNKIVTKEQREDKIQQGFNYSTFSYKDGFKKRFIGSIDTPFITGRINGDQ